MDINKKEQIEKTIDSNIKIFVNSLEKKHLAQINDPDGVINKKINNIFIKELNSEFAFYSALVRSFDSSFGTILENIGNEIAKLNFETMNEIDSYILPPQQSKIQELIDNYTTDAEHRIKPKIEHYNNYDCIVPKNITSFTRKHITDHCFYNREKDIYYIIELKAGGDLDNKKAPAEKKELLNEYFMLKNLIKGEKTIKLFFATAYNKYGEGNEWKQTCVKNCFEDRELLIGKDYWNFICNDEDGFKIVMEQYKKSCVHIKNALDKIKKAYL